MIENNMWSEAMVRMKSIGFLPRTKQPITLLLILILGAGHLNLKKSS